MPEVLVSLMLILILLVPVLIILLLLVLLLLQVGLMIGTENFDGSYKLKFKFDNDLSRLILT